MQPLISIPDVIRNHAEIVALAMRHADLFASYPTAEALAARDGRQRFDPHRDTEYEDDDRYHVLQLGQMPRELRVAIARAIADNGRDPGKYYAQLQRYDAGDFVLPHRDRLVQGLYNLTSATQDGLVVQDAERGFIKHVDRAGTFLLHDMRAWHWVDPVLEPVRFTMITIPPLFTFDELQAQAALRT
jgi:hypothetical protein